MLIIKYTVETTIAPPKIWQVWQDVENWNSWDYGIKFCRLNGPFQTGTRGSLQPLDAPLLETQLTHVEPFKMFVLETKLLLAKAVGTHIINQIAGKTYVTFQTEIRGPLAFLYVWKLGASIKKRTPIEMEEMLKKARAL